MKTWHILLTHQLLFQGMFFTKNFLLKKKTGLAIRGNNIEARLSVAFFALYISLSFLLASMHIPVGKVMLFSPAAAAAAAGFLLIMNLAVSAFSLIHLKDSWRVGIPENQKTSLVTSGIYRISRNPYFVSYGMMFLAYAILLQNVVLLSLTGIGCFFVHLMVKKEESHLTSLHGDKYLAYMKSTPRYLLF